MWFTCSRANNARLTLVSSWGLRSSVGLSSYSWKNSTLNDSRIMTWRIKICGLRFSLWLSPGTGSSLFHLRATLSVVRGFSFWGILDRSRFAIEHGLEVFHGWAVVIGKLLTKLISSWRRALRRLRRHCSMVVISCSSIQRILGKYKVSVRGRFGSGTRFWTFWHSLVWSRLQFISACLEDKHLSQQGLWLPFLSTTKDVSFDFLVLTRLVSIWVPFPEIVAILTLRNWSESLTKVGRRPQVLLILRACVNFWPIRFFLHRQPAGGGQRIYLSRGKHRHWMWELMHQQHWMWELMHQQHWMCELIHQQHWMWELMHQQLMSHWAILQVLGLVAFLLRALTGGEQWRTMHWAVHLTVHWAVHCWLEVLSWEGRVQMTLQHCVRGAQLMGTALRFRDARTLVPPWWWA